MTAWPPPFVCDDVPVRVKVRFLRHLAPVMADDDSCWEWPKSAGSHRYGQIGWQNDKERGLVLTHRLSWLIFNGEIPAGMTVDHLCRNRTCCNPSHLRLLSNVANASDNGFATRTHCPAGHAYDEANTRRNSMGHRSCRECSNARKRAA